MKSVLRPHRDALERLSDRIDELVDLYTRMALHVGFVDKPTKPIRPKRPTDPGQRKNIVFNLDLRDIAALKDRAHEESKKTGRRVTQQSLVDTALKAYLYE
jgi:hypothetical protein